MTVSTQKSDTNNSAWPLKGQLHLAVVALTLLVIAEDGTELRPITWTAGPNVGIAIANWKRKHRDMEMVGFTVITDGNGANKDKPMEVPIKRWPRPPRKTAVVTNSVGG